MDRYSSNRGDVFLSLLSDEPDKFFEDPPQRSSMKWLTTSAITGGGDYMWGVSFYLPNGQYNDWKDTVCWKIHFLVLTPLCAVIMLIAEVLADIQKKLGIGKSQGIFSIYRSLGKESLGGPGAEFGFEYSLVRWDIRRYDSIE